MARQAIRFSGTKRFERDIKRFIKQTRINADVVARRLTQEVFEGVVQRTPVDTGWARANWLVSANFRAQGTPVPKPGDNNVLPEPKFPGVSPNPDGASYWVVNNVDYIGLLEDGRSKQIGKGFMVQRTLVAVQARLKNIQRELS